jgi:tetratricopeptide (TPR) repeat protein
MDEQIAPDQMNKDGMEAYQAEDFEKALECFTSAKNGYTLSGNTSKAAEMANNLCVIYLKQDEPQTALDLVSGTEQVFAEAGDVQRQALAFGNRAAALEALGKRDEALAAYQKSSDLLKITGDRENRATVLATMSRLQMRSGKRLEAMATMQASLDNRPKLGLREKMLNQLLKIPFKLFHSG